MSKICDRSPCDALLDALGTYVFGSVEGFYMVVQGTSGMDIEVPIDYCPFCGTRLEEVPQAIVEKFTRPRRRRRHHRLLQT